MKGVENLETTAERKPHVWAHLSLRAWLAVNCGALVISEKVDNLADEQQLERNMLWQDLEFYKLSQTSSARSGSGSRKQGTARKVKTLDDSFSVIKVGSREMVKSVPMELNRDQALIMSHCQSFICDGVPFISKLIDSSLHINACRTVANR